MLGQFTSEKAVENPEMMDGWYEREYRVIARASNSANYDGTKKWWTPNDNSTCIKVDESDHALFEELILQPYFNMSVEDLFSGAKEPRRYWWLTANPKIWSFADIKIGEEQSYTLYNENGNKRRVFQNFLDAKVGDIVIGYEANPVKKIVAIAEITQANDGNNIYFAKTEGLSVPIEYSVLKGYPELEKMEFFVQPNGSLFKLTKGEFDFIMDIIREENPVKPATATVTKYTKADFLIKVFMTEERYDVLEALLRNKMNVILQGAPGVGKTFAAKKLAYAMMGEVDDSRIELVQFHQNYSYEDFIMGYRPDGADFKLTDGVFYRFCQTAANHPDKEYFFIIDEINRGNMSKIFGELMMLIEKDYRGTKATLAYSGMPFSVPENLYIIGMMNTADRSLAMIDYMLMRGKNLETGVFSKEEREVNLLKFKNALDKVTNLNNWHTFMGLFADAGYITSNIVASTNAIVFCYVLYLIGKYDYKVPPVILQKIIKKWIFMSTITSFYTVSTESEVEKQLADLRNVHTADAFVAYLDGVISTKFSDDYFNLTLPADLMSAAATSPAWLGYIAALNVLGTPMLFSTTTLAAKLLPGASGDKKAIDKHHIFPKNYLTGIGYTSDRDRNQVANFTYLDYNTNIDISDDSPAEYVDRYRQKLGDEGYKKSCAENALPVDFEKMSYPNFLEQRRKLMADIVKKAYQKLCE